MNRSVFRALTLNLTFALHCLLSPSAEAIEQPFANPNLTERLERAGENSASIAAALHGVAPDCTAGMEFLVLNMPERDLQTLSSAFLVEHVNLAYEAKLAAKWGKQIPDSIFLNDLLPYASVNESRDDVRRKLREQFWPQVKDCDSISKAAAQLNHLVFEQLNVRYSTARRRADQGPIETMKTGIASCTGLSILLIDACRACGIPARFVGTPAWSDQSGNHSWVEVWDQGWHFTGAAEPVEDRLDEAWFTERAARASLTDDTHGIFAVSFKKTATRFPMVWSRTRYDFEISAVNVTDRYTSPRKALNDGKLLLRFRALDTTQERRCEANLVVHDLDGNTVFRGQTKGESSDSNDHITARLKPGKYRVTLRNGPQEIKQHIQATADGQLVSFALPPKTIEPDDKASKESDDTNNASTGEEAIENLKAFLQKGSLEDLGKQSFAVAALSREQAATAITLIDQARQEIRMAGRKLEHEEERLRIGDLEMPFASKTFGDKPEKGHSLVISMHGGGGAPARVNDSQWENQKRLYQLEEGIYVAPRAPTDTWNLWHQSHIDAFLTKLIENMIHFEGIDPNRVYITGYSAGGDGVFQLAPRMADQLAAAAMMAGHPNETKPDGLRNLPFTLHMGANDAAYDRNAKAADWKSALADLRESDPTGYEHWVEIHDGKGHWMDREDAAGVKWMQQFERNIIPEKVVWLQDDVLHDRFYWLAVPQEEAKQRSRIVASYSGSSIEIQESEPDELQVLLRDDMMNLDEQIQVVFDGKTIYEGTPTRSIATIARTLLDRGDVEAVFTATVSVPVRE